MKPICYDLYCGLGGWTEAFLAEGYECIGFDIEAHDYGTGGYPGKLILRDVRSIHGSELADATIIVGSSPCQEFSYRAMPWKRAKALPPPYLGMELFNAQFRIQREASEAAGRHIPMIVENVKGAQKWVGRSRWHYGSFYLWGDIPALMPMTFKSPGQPSGMEYTTLVPSEGFKTSGLNWSNQEKRGQDFTRIAGSQIKNNGGSWFAIGSPGQKVTGQNPDGRLYADRDSEGTKQHGSGHVWYRTGNGALPSASKRRKAASAMIAKIPFPLAQHIARTFKPVTTA